MTGGPTRRPFPRRLPGATRCAVLALAGLAVAACATGAGRVHLEDPDALAREIRRATVPEGQWRLTLDWEYTDRRGPVGGEGVLRYTSPDSLRLDLFGPGDAAMSVALVGGPLRSVGQIRDVRLPPPAFLYAAAGLFRPGRTRPDEAWRRDSVRTLVYGTEGGELRFRFRGRRLTGVEERRDGREVRRLHLRWSDSASARRWPRSAEFRDIDRGSRARWTVRRARPADAPFSPEIYDLPTASP